MYMSKGISFEVTGREIVEREWNKAGIKDDDEDREEKVNSFWKHCNDLVRSDMREWCLLWLSWSWNWHMFDDVYDEITKDGNNISGIEGLAQGAAYIDLFEMCLMGKKELQESIIDAQYAYKINGEFVKKLVSKYGKKMDAPTLLYVKAQISISEKENES